MYGFLINPLFFFRLTNAASNQTKPKENISQMSPLASHRGGTEEAIRGISARGAATVDALSSNVPGPRAAQKGKGKASEQEGDEGRPTLESLLANHASLNVTNALEVLPPFARGEFADVHSGSCRKRKVLLNAIFILDSAKKILGLR